MRDTRVRRAIFIVLDGVGVGALPDAGACGDGGSDTLGNVGRTVELRLPFLEHLGLGNISPIAGVPPVARPLCLCGRLAPMSAGKDTTVGHWEHMGLITSEPFPTYPNGFPAEIIAQFSERIGRGVLGNKPASGTAIIAELGEEHQATGLPIVYTSADSVFQIATHVDVVPLEQLYSWCRTARELLQGPHGVARVIARPFAGSARAFYRTADRRDFSLEPPGQLYLDTLYAASIPVLAVGKISEIYAGRGITEKLKVGSNEENLRVLTELVVRRSSAAKFDRGLLMSNLVDFDMVWGHRNDVEGFAKGLQAADTALSAVFEGLGPDDLLILTADHGVDPTTPSTDHSREYVPMLLYPRPRGATQATYEGDFADIGATLCRFLTGSAPALAGLPIHDLRPQRGWRRYTPVQPSPTQPSTALPCRLGKEEVAAAARWLAGHVGAPPDVAVVLGSGLAPTVPGPAAVVAEVAYRDVPHWPVGSISGHPQIISLVRWEGLRVALLAGRVHGYEGYDLSEVQMAVRTVAAWGTRRLLLTSASGAVDEALEPGDTVLVAEVLDLQFSDPRQGPIRLQASSAASATCVPLPRGVHASVPGPQYESPADLAVLRALGASTVSMSPAGEIRAAHDERLELAALAVVANAGHTTHAEVLAGTARAATSLTEAIASVLRAWHHGPSE